MYSTEVDGISVFKYILHISTYEEIKNHYECGVISATFFLNFNQKSIADYLFDWAMHLPY